MLMNIGRRDKFKYRQTLCLIIIMRPLYMQYNNARDAIQSLRYTEVVKRATVEVSLAYSPLRLTEVVSWNIFV